MWKWVWDIWRGHDFDIINTILYLSKNTYIRLKEKVFSRFPLRRWEARRVTSLFWLRAELMWTRFTHFTHSLTPVMKLYWERNACGRQSLSGIYLKTGKFPTCFNSETSVCMKQSNIWQHSQVLVSSSRFIEALEKHCSVCVNIKHARLFISQLFYKLFYWMD